MKQQIFLLVVLIFLFSIGNSFENTKEINEPEYQVDCYIQNDVQLVNCLLDLNPNVTSLQIKQDNYASPNISALNTYLPQNPQLTKLSLFFIDIQSAAPLYTCLDGLTNLKYLKIAFDRLYNFDVNKFETMFQDQYQSVTEFIFLADCIVESIEPFANVIRQFTELENLTFEGSPEHFHHDPKMQNLSVLKGGLFNNNHKLQKLSLDIINTDWSKKQISGFTQIFQNVPSLRTLSLNLKQCELKEIDLLVDTFSPIYKQLVDLTLNLSWNPIVTFEPLQTILPQFTSLNQINLITGSYQGNEFKPQPTYFTSLGNLFQNFKQLHSAQFTVSDFYEKNSNIFQMSDLQNLFSNTGIINADINLNHMNIHSIETFENLFTDAVNVQFLKVMLGDNKVSDIDPISLAIQSLGNLTSIDLDLRTNQISSISSIIESLNQVQKLESIVLDLDKNCILGITEDQIEYQIKQVLPNIESVVINLGVQQDWYCGDNDFIIQ